MSSKLEEKLVALVEPLATSLGLDLVELTFLQLKKKSVLQIFADKQGGITLDDLTELNHLVSDMMDAEDPVAGAYTLEVSSPGLDRPLKSERDFWRKVGSAVSVTYKVDNESEAKECDVSGEIIAVEAGIITIKPEDTEAVEIAISSIIQAKLVY